MAWITTCSRCGTAYEESSRENADHPNWAENERLCDACFHSQQNESRSYWVTDWEVTPPSNLGEWAKWTCWSGKKD